MHRAVLSETCNYLQSLFTLLLGMADLQFLIFAQLDQAGGGLAYLFFILVVLADKSFNAPERFTYIDGGMQPLALSLNEVAKRIDAEEEQFQYLVVENRIGFGKEREQIFKPVGNSADLAKTDRVGISLQSMQRAQQQLQRFLVGRILFQSENTLISRLQDQGSLIEEEDHQNLDFLIAEQVV